MAELPTGTVTFLFTDIEGSTRLWEQHPEAMREALARHDTLLRQAIESHAGQVFKTVGDQFCAAFATAPGALAAAIAAEQALQAEPWPEIGPLRVRMALHTGTAQERDGDYFGPPLNRVARLLEAGHGGQILVSVASQELVRDHLSEGTSLRDLGEHRLKDLVRPERIFQLLHPNLPAAFRPLQSLDARPHNLPAQPTPLIGREPELEAVQSLLRREEVRLVTLTGPGGTGKTRLGLQVAADLLDDFRDGVFFVGLAPLVDPDLVLSAVAHTLAVREAGGQSLLERVTAYLREKQLLLLLDNFEHIVAAASIVTELLAATPRLKVLITSRAPLHVRGEREYPVPPLARPDPERLPSPAALSQYASVALFIQRAMDVKPDFTVTNENAPAVAEICHRLDGLPLAIELAAARIKLFPPQSLLSRLENRLKLLVGGARDLPARQQTLRSAMAWSYDLLDEGEKKLFRRLSVFAGGFTLEAAGRVSSAEDDLELDLLDGVVALVDQSLLRQEEGPAREPRFWMLETIREFAQEALAQHGEADAVRERHARFFVAWAEETHPMLKELDPVTWLHGPEHAIWYDSLETERDNLRAALDWCRTGAGHEAMELHFVELLARFWTPRGHLREGRAQITRTLARTKDLGRTVDRAALCIHAGWLSYLMQDPVPAREQCEEALAVWQELGDRRQIAHALTLIGQTYRQQGDLETARRLMEEALSIAREAGAKSEIGVALCILGMIALSQHDYVTARSLLEESLPIQQEVGDNRGAATTLRNLGTVAIQEGNLREAGQLYRASLRRLYEIGSTYDIPWGLAWIAGLAVAQGQLEPAARLYGAVTTLCERIGLPLNPRLRGEYERNLARLRTELDAEAFAAAWAAGQAWTLEEAVSAVLQETPDA